MQTLLNSKIKPTRSGIKELVLYLIAVVLAWIFTLWAGVLAGTI